jgi:hypothetical protein
MTTSGTSTIARRGAALAALLAALLCRGAGAQELGLEAQPPGQENVWSKGVPEPERRAADALFKEGNALLRESITISAAAKYREALAHWDHPNIHYNLALALMSLDQPVETHGHLVAAMRFGPSPLGAERFEHARNYRALLEHQLVRVKIRCAVPGASVSLDGRPLFAAPGEQEALLPAGRHTFVASKPGLVTNTAVRTLEGGQALDLDLEVKSLEQLTDYRRRWPVWQPWTLVAAGAVVAGGGGALHYTGLQKISWVDSQSRARCPDGCAAEPGDLASARRQGATFQGLGYAAYGVGGAAIVTGAVLVLLNRGERVVRTYDGETPARAGPRASLELTPILDRDRGGLVATLRY